jgi:hypothetical protein
MIITFFLWVPFPLANILILPNIQISANTLNIASRIANQLNKLAQTLNAPVLYLCRSTVNFSWFFLHQIHILSLSKFKEKDLSIRELKQNLYKYILVNSLWPLNRGHLDVLVMGKI